MLSCKRKVIYQLIKFYSIVVFFIFIVDDTSDFKLTLTHSDMNDEVQASYKLGDFIKFKLDVHSGTPVEGHIMKCWATDGIANYDLITNRFAIQIQYDFSSLEAQDTIIAILYQNLYHKMIAVLKKMKFPYSLAKDQLCIASLMMNSLTFDIISKNEIYYCVIFLIMMPV